GGGAVPRQFSFTLPDGPLGAGQIVVAVTTNANSAITERNDAVTASTNNTSTIGFTSSLAHYADLEVNNLSASATQGFPGGQVALSGNDINVGTKDASGSWVDSVYISSDPSGSGGQFLGAFPVTGVLSAGDGTGIANSATVTLPAFGVGNRYFVINTDA